MMDEEKKKKEKKRFINGSLPLHKSPPLVYPELAESSPPSKILFL
jgi:hypothetical protein